MTIPLLDSMRRVYSQSGADQETVRLVAESLADTLERNPSFDRDRFLRTLAASSLWGSPMYFTASKVLCKVPQCQLSVGKQSGTRNVESIRPFDPRGLKRGQPGDQFRLPCKSFTAGRERTLRPALL